MIRKDKIMALAVLLAVSILILMVLPHASYCKPHADGEISILWFTSYSNSDKDAKMYYWLNVVNETGKIRDVCLNSVDSDKSCDIDPLLWHNYTTYFDPLTNTTFVKDANEWEMKHKLDYMIVEEFGLDDRYDTPILWDCDREIFIKWETGEGYDV